MRTALFSHIAKIKNYMTICHNNRGVIIITMDTTIQDKAFKIRTTFEIHIHQESDKLYDECWFELPVPIFCKTFNEVKQTIETIISACYKTSPIFNCFYTDDPSYDAYCIDDYNYEPTSTTRKMTLGYMIKDHKQLGDCSIWFDVKIINN